MRPISDATIVEQYQKLVDEMMVMATSERDFDNTWLLDHAWSVVPVKSEYGHFSFEEIDRIVPTLNQGAYCECLAIATEPVNPLPACYRVVISGDDFRNFNRECGLLRYLLMNEARSWAISCYGTYKLFAGPTPLLESLLGLSILAGRKSFWQFAQDLEHDDSESHLLKVAQKYATI